MADLSITATEVKLVSGPTGQLIAGVAITAGQALYKDSATGKAGLADADSVAALADCIGLALHAASAGQPVEYAMDGAVVDLGATAATPAGKAYIVSSSAGGLSPHTDATTPATGEFATYVCAGIGSNRVRVKINATGVAAA